VVARRGQPSLGHDPGKRAGWEYRAIHGINKETAYTRGYYQAGLSFFSALRRAADHRGISASAYLRRAVAAFAAKDLGIPFEGILKDSPSPGWSTHRQDLPRQRKTQVFRKEFDDGTGYGSWEVK
jgi:hypothetical protein